jgi:hypothetical protein
MDKLWFLSIAMVAVGFGTTASMIPAGVRRVRQIRRGVRIVGRVVSLRPVTDLDRSDLELERPVIAFRAPDGQEREYGLPETYVKGRWWVGREAAVLFDPNNPDATVWADHPWAEVGLKLAIGCVLVAVGTALGTWVVCSQRD